MQTPGTGQSFTAELYDGVSSVPFSGAVEFGVNEICFTEISGSSEMSVYYSYADVLDIITRKDQTRLIIKGAKPDAPDVLLVILEPGISRIIKKRVVYHSKNGIAGILNRFRWMSVGKKIFWLIAAVFLMMVSYFWCLHRVYFLVPNTADIFIGDKIAGLLIESEEICSSPELQDRLKTTLAAIAPSDSGFEYDISVISKNEMNAFALPGGKIFVFSGLLAKADSTEEIAGVLAHEIAHVEKRHGIQNLIRAVGIHYIISIALGAGFEDLESIETLSEFADLLIILKYSRDFEHEADRSAADLLHRSGISVAGLKSFMVNLQEQSRSDAEETGPGENRLMDFLSTHPPTPERIKNLNQIIEKEEGLNSDIFEEGVDWNSLSESCGISGDEDEIL